MELGTQVSAPGVLRRRSGPDGARWWERASWAGPVSGMYIGYRYYKNGKVEYGGLEEGNIFHADEQIKIALIVPDARQKPIPVLFSEMTSKERPSGKGDRNDGKNSMATD